LEARIKELEILLEQEKNNMTKGNEKLMEEIRKLKQDIEDLKAKSAKELSDLQSKLNQQRETELKSQKDKYEQ
jgi:molybdenum-dependent DNA-binding transcriptional regulator ModE